ncbi:MAG TPA: DinB family protein, partial [Gemmatimonadaceae bacterium]|nr:DinB family protein [Gemmatimonadaceae bacterium]
ILRALKGEPVLGGGFPPAPATWGEVMEALDKVNADILAAGGTPHNPNLDGTASFFVGPKQMGDIPLDRFLMFMLHDQIHHRGQLSVYVRMAGGKVPSIYGPSADEPWN